MRAILLAAIVLLAVPTSASAWVLGAGDRADADPNVSAELGATAYRVVIDPSVPLESYDARIEAHRAVGQAPQLVIGGTGTIDHQSSRGVVRAAVAAAQRWPDAFSVSVVNEPNESGMGVCEYARVYAEAYHSLRAIGVRRILFGEWSPNNAVGWQWATLNPQRCHATALLLRRIVKHVAWHAYSAASLNAGRELQSIAVAFTGHTPDLYMTEAGYVLSTFGAKHADTGGLAYWRRALRAVRRDHVREIVSWDVSTPAAWSVWDASLIEPSGRPRPAFWLLRDAAR